MIFKDLIKKLKSFTWFISPEHKGAIRTLRTEPHKYEMCPLVACVSVNPKARYLINSKWDTAAQLLGMSLDDAEIVVKASDTSLGKLEADLRYLKHMLKEQEADDKPEQHKKFTRQRIRTHRRAIHLRRRLERELLQ